MQRKTLLTALPCLAFALCASAPGAAQVVDPADTGPWRLEGRAGLAEPVGDFGNLDLGTGATLSATLSYRLSDELHAYGGWGWHLLDADSTVLPDGAIEETGYVLGLAFESPFGRSDWDYRAHAGVTYEHIEIEDDDGDVIDDSGHGAGFEVGAAMIVPLAGRLSLVPGLRYRYLSRDVGVRGRGSSKSLDFLAIDVGLLWNF